MPMTWIEPEVLTTHRGVTVYHTYKNDCIEDRMTYWYSTDPMDSEDFCFDVRELPVPDGVEPENHELIIAHALDNDLIDLADDLEVEPEEPAVKAVLRDDQTGISVAVDLAPWLDEASAETIAQIQKADWSGNEFAADITKWMDIRDYRVAGLAFRHREQIQDDTYKGVVIQAADVDVEQYLEENHPEKYGKALFINRLAVKFDGAVDEVITIRKYVSGYMPIPEPEFQECLVDEDTGELNETAIVDLRSDIEFEEKLSKHIRDKAYEHLITEDGDHGWEVTDSEGPIVDAVEIHDFQ